jgi:hypothetical protein
MMAITLLRMRSCLGGIPESPVHLLVLLTQWRRRFGFLMLPPVGVLLPGQTAQSCNKFPLHEHKPSGGGLDQETFF